MRHSSSPAPFQRWVEPEARRTFSAAQVSTIPLFDHPESFPLASTRPIAQALSLRNFYNQSLNNQTGELVIDVDGLNAGTFDVLNLMGGGNLNGTLRLRINYSPNNGDTVRFMTVGGGFIFDGAFSNLIAPPGWSLRYSAGGVDAVFCLADFNSDGSADFFDYLNFVADFSAADPRADFNSDGVIDFFDYLDFVAAFSASC